ncbi:MAG: DUF1559 domain-containing protein [Gemmataceae bacterium]|nr:DUF1559 domain-containing protein [Gemmataceae bacterium]MCI0739292.1 DUF1559 domain-containing protein [Gemmataceae bacterium]
MVIMASVFNSGQYSSRRRRAFSLIELLVAIGIIAVLLSLLLPAVQNVRARANRSVCQNNLRQIGLAFHNYHGVTAAFPPGLCSPVHKSGMGYLSWNGHLLPFLEESALWDKIMLAYQSNPDFRAVPPHIHRGTVVVKFGCPADSRVSAPSTKLGSLKVAFTSYLGVSGLDAFHNDGILFLDSRTRLLDVSDGASNTLIVGERPPSADERYGWWYAGWGQVKDGSCEMVMGVREINVAEADCWSGPYEFGRGRVENQCDLFHYWSLHTSGANFLFADGAVRFMRYSSGSVLPELASRAGGKVAIIPD